MSGNLPLEFLKLETQKRENQQKRNIDATKTSYGMLEKKYNREANRRNENDDYSDMYSAMRSGLGESAKEGWGSLADGVLNGLSIGQKKKANTERRDKTDAVSRTLEFFESNLKALQERNAWNAANQSLQEKYAPLAIAAVEGRIPEEGAREAMQAYVQDHNKHFKSNLSLVGYDPRNFTGMIKDNDTGQIEPMNLAEKFQDQLSDNKLEKLRQEAIDSQKRIETRENQQLAINQQNANAISDRLKFAQDPSAQYDVNAGKEQGKKDAEKRSKLSDENLALEDVSYKIKDLKEVLKDNEIITGQTIGSRYDRLIGEYTGNEAYSNTELYDSISKGLLSFVKGNIAFGNMNQKEFEFLTDQLPDSHKTKSALDRMLNRFEKTLERQINTNQKVIDSVPYYGHESKQQTPTPQQPQPEGVLTNGAQGANMPQTTGDGDKVTMLFPGGAKKLVDKTQVAEYSKWGTVVG